MKAIGVASRAPRSLARRLLGEGVVKWRRPSKRSRGFTLIELMIGVCIIGILATLAVYGVRKYVLAAKTSEPLEIINSIKAAQESYRDETFGYFKVSDMSSYFPFTGVAALKNAKAPWDSGNATILAAWNQLGVRPSAPVQFGYACDAAKGTGVPTQAALGISRSLNYPTTFPDWYVVRAAGDRDGNGVLATFVGSNFTDEIYGENDTE
jgi:prepilin-type N-terminal cleavage/methylation domain-containing protein